MISRIKSSAILTLQVLVISALVFFIYAVFLDVFGEDKSNFFVSIPFLNGFVHGSINHLGLNLALIFVMTLAQINWEYDIRRIFWVTFLLSCLYLPFSWMDLAPYAIGISGTCFFLMSRFFFSRNSRKILWASVFCLPLFIEASALGDDDGTSHAVHLLGAIAGYVSLKKDTLRIPNFIAKYL